MKQNIFIIAGEPSGDLRAGELVKELRKILPDAAFWGIGGDRMETEGVELIEHIRNLSLVGVLETIRKLPRVFGQFRTIEAAVKKRRPDIAILVDYPGFNLRVAKYLHSEKIPVAYYVIPQVWAWGANRVKRLKAHVDRAFVLFDFEKDFLSGYGVDARFAGHPIVDAVREYEASGIPSRGSATHGENTPLTVGILPGSRKSEILAMLPRMLEASRILSSSIRDIRFVIAESSNIDTALYASFISGYSDLNILRIKDNTFTALDMCDFAMVTSGTATLEAACMGIPFILVYHAALLTYILYRLFIRIPFLGLVNIVAGKEVAPECLQAHAKPAKLAKTALDMIQDPGKMAEAKAALLKVREALGKGGAAATAAGEICRLMKEKGLV